MPSSSDGKDFNTDITADPSKFEQGMKTAARSAIDASDTINAQFKKVGDTFNVVTKYMLGFTAVLAGGGALKKFINDANEWNGEAGKMAKQLGISTEKASVLNVALNHLGVSADVYTTASEKLAKQIETNGAAFEELGVKVRDSSGAYRPVTELMGEVNQKLAEIKNPIEQNIAGQQVYGKGWSEVRGILRLTAQTMNDAETRARQLGLIVGPEGVAASKQYKEQMRDLQLVGKSLEVQFGNALLPVFVKTGKFLGEEGPEMGRVFARVLEGLVFAAQSVWLALKDMGDALGALAAQGSALLSADLAAFRAIGAERDRQSKLNEEAYQRLKDNFGKALPGAQAIPADPDTSGGPQYHFKEKSIPVVTASEQSRMADWEASLSQQKAAYERAGLLEGQYREISKDRELNYWQTIRTYKDLSTQEQTAIDRKAADVEMAMIKETFDAKVATLQAESAQYKNNTDERLRIERQVQAMYAEGTKEFAESQKRVNEIQRQAVEQDRAFVQSRVEAEREAALQLISLQEQSLQQGMAMGLVNQRQAIAQEQAFEQQRYAIAYEALRQRLEVAGQDPDRNPVELEKIHRQIEQLEQQHQLRMGAIRNASILESTKNLRDYVGSLSSGIQGVLGQIGTQIKSIGDLTKALWQTIAQTTIQMGAKIVAEWIKEQLILKLFGKTMALGKIAEKAAEAGAGGIASMAAAPFPLNLSAPAFGASMAAAALAFAPAASAAGGYDIPGSVNPIVQAHAKEMILPAKVSDWIRAATNEGAGGGSAPAMAPIVIPEVGVSEFFIANRRELAKALKAAQRDFHLPR